MLPVPSATARSASAGLEISVATNFPFRRCAVAAPASASVSAIITCAPSSWKRSAIPAPMPRAAPMISAILPARRPLMLLAKIRSPCRAMLPIVLPAGNGDLLRIKSGARRIWVEPRSSLQARRSNPSERQAPQRISCAIARSRSSTPRAGASGVTMRGVRHVQRVWRRRPRLDAYSVVLHVIDDPILAVGTDGELQLAGPAHDRIGAQVAEAVIPRPAAPARLICRWGDPSSRWPTSARARRQVQARRISAFRRGDGQTRDASRPRLAWPRAHAPRCGTSRDRALSSVRWTTRHGQGHGSPSSMLSSPSPVTCHGRSVTSPCKACGPLLAVNGYCAPS